MWNDHAPQLETGFARLPARDGLRLFYRRTGADGPTVLLLHGWPETSHAWRRVMPTLASSGYTVVAPDLRGTGASDKPTDGYDALSRMEDVRALLAALELGQRPVYVVGHSDEGGRVAQAYAIAHPSEVAGLALVSPGALFWLGRPVAHQWHHAFHQTPDLPEALIAPQLEAYLRHFFQSWSHDPHMLPDADLAVYVGHLSAPGALRASLAPARAATGDIAYMARDFRKPVECPVRLIMGQSDPRSDSTFTEADWKRAARRLNVEAIARGGHWLPEERPDALATALLTFFQECSDVPGTC